VNFFHRIKLFLIFGVRAIALSLGVKKTPAIRLIWNFALKNSEKEFDPIRNWRLFNRLYSWLQLKFETPNSVQDFKEVWRKLLPTGNGHDLIRIGSTNDGGYLVPDDLDGIQECFSPGAVVSWAFEEELGKRFGIHSHICDGTIERFPEFEYLTEFTAKNVGPSSTGSEISFEEWISHRKSESDLILQMDIEGAEYLIIPSLNRDTLSQFRVIVLELHDLQLSSTASFFTLQLNYMLEKFLLDFDLIHMHPNNAGGKFFFCGKEFPKIVELTFHRKDRYKSKSVAVLPHSLDQDNVSHKPTMKNYGFVRWINAS